MDGRKTPRDAVQSDRQPPAKPEVWKGEPLNAGYQSGPINSRDVVSASVCVSVQLDEVALLA